MTKYRELAYEAYKNAVAIAIPAKVSLAIMRLLYMYIYESFTYLLFDSLGRELPDEIPFLSEVLKESTIQGTYLIEVLRNVVPYMESAIATPEVMVTEDLMVLRNLLKVLAYLFGIKYVKEYDPNCCTLLCSGVYHNGKFSYSSAAFVRVDGGE